MSAVIRLATKPVTSDDVLRAWATYRALQLAGVDDASLANDLAHQEAATEAYGRYFRLYSEWCRE